MQDETALRRLLYVFTHHGYCIQHVADDCPAFLCLVLSPIMPVRTFGIFAAMVVVCNYVMVLTMIPTCLILHGCYFWPRRWREKLPLELGTKE